ncbi:hypothetical protein AMTRI_Chr11g150910 [Amborella trichopoda]
MSQVASGPRQTKKSIMGPGPEVSISPKNIVWDLFSRSGDFRSR